MAKRHEVRSMFRDKETGIFFTRDNESQLSKLSETNLNRRIRDGFVVEHNVPETEKMGPGDASQAEDENPSRKMKGGR